MIKVNDETLTIARIRNNGWVCKPEKNGIVVCTRFPEITICELTREEWRELREFDEECRKADEEYKNGKLVDHLKPREW